MKLQGIYVKSTKEILFSRRNYEIREAEDKSASISGGYTNPQISCKDIDNIIDVQLNGNVLLDFILKMDALTKNKNARDYPEGYHGRFKIVKNSNLDFYKELIVNFEDIEDILKDFINN